MRKKVSKRQKAKLKKGVKELICSVTAAISFGVTVALLNRDIIREKVFKISVENTTSDNV